MELINMRHDNVIAVMSSDYCVLEAETLKHTFLNNVHVPCLKGLESHVMLYVICFEKHPKY